MTFEATPIPGAFVLTLTPAHDERGFFARTSCTDGFRAHGLNPHIAQSSLSQTVRRGTVRGMHYQKPPGAEAKVVRCFRGAIFDVAVDLRPTSPAYLQWWSVELTADNRRSFYVPEGCAHGFQTLDDDCEVFYQISAPYAPDLAGGFRYDDPLVGIAWPLPVSAVGPKDLAWAPLTRGAGA